jgi:transcription termination/antitermination protein NusG
VSDELDNPTREPGDDQSLREGNGQPAQSQTDFPAELSRESNGEGELTNESQLGAETMHDDAALTVGHESSDSESSESELSVGAGEASDAAGAIAADAPASASREPTAEPAAEAPPAKPKKVRTPGKPVEEAPVDEPGKKEWYILKVQSNREDSIADALQRRIAIAGLERFFDEIIVPIEKVSEFKNGKKRVVKRKIYPGYIVVHMELNDDTWFLVRETPGIGDFTGSGGKPTPMSPSDVNKIVSKQEDKAEEQITVDVRYKSGDRVRINEGTFENFEGDVDSIDAVNGRVTVMINIFGRSTPVELETWQVESL